MKKFITTLCLILCLLMAFSAVGCTGKEWKVGYAGGEVSSNGGFSVEVGDYVYFINGIATATDKNDFGTPVKGSLVRMKKADLKNPQEATSAEVVVPKLFASSYYQAGVSIFNDYVYYASPNADTNKKGEVLNSQIVFYKTKLDGTGTTKILTCDSLSQEYKFVQVGQEIYLITVTASSTESNATYALKVYNANTGAKLFEKEDADSYAIPTELSLSADLGYIFFTDKIKDENEQDKEYGALYAYKLGEEKEGVLFSGAIVEDGSFGTKGYSFKALKYVNGCLYFTDYNVNSSSDDLFFYFVEITSSIKVLDTESETFEDDNKANYAQIVELQDVLGANVKTAISKTSIFNSKTEIIYFEASVGLLSYDYTGEASVLVYKSKLSTLTSPTFKLIENGFAYFADSSNILYRIKLDDATAELQKITPVSSDTGWYNIEVVTVDGIDYVLLNLNGEPYNKYIFAMEADVEAKIARENADELPETTAADYQEKLDEMVEEYFKAIGDKEEDAITALLNLKIGVTVKADKDLVNSYMSSNYASSSSSSSK